MQIFCNYLQLFCNCLQLFCNYLQLNYFIEGPQSLHIIFHRPSIVSRKSPFRNLGRNYLEPCFVLPKGQMKFVLEKSLISLLGEQGNHKEIKRFTLYKGPQNLCMHMFAALRLVLPPPPYSLTQDSSPSVRDKPTREFQPKDEAEMEKMQMASKRESQQLAEQLTDPPFSRKRFYIFLTCKLRGPYL